MRRLIRVFFIAAAGALLLSACGGEENEATHPTPVAEPATPLTPIKVSISTYTGAANTSTFLQAVIMGEKLDQKHGVIIERYESPSPSALEQALVQGKMDVGFAAPLTIAAINAEQGKDFVFFSHFAVNQTPVVVKPDAAFATLSDLKGKKVCAYAPGTASFTTSQLLAAVSSLDWEKDFSVLTGEPAFCVAALVEKDDVAAAALHEPLSTNLIGQKKVRELLFVATELQRKSGMIVPGNNNVVASRAWIEKNPEAARRVAAMYREAADFIVQNPDLALDRYGKETGLAPEVSRDLAKSNFLRLFVPSSQAPELIRSYDSLLQQSVDAGILKKKPSQPIAISLK